MPEIHFLTAPLLFLGLQYPSMDNVGDVNKLYKINFDTFYKKRPKEALEEQIGSSKS